MAHDLSVKGKPKPSGHWSEKVLRITPRCPLAVLKPDTIVNQGSVRQANDAAAKGVCGCQWTWSTTVKPTKIQKQSFKQKLGINANLVYAEDVSFESSNIIFHIKNKHSVASSRRDHRHESAFITGAAAAPDDRVSP